MQEADLDAFPADFNAHFAKFAKRGNTARPFAKKPKPTAKPKAETQTQKARNGDSSPNTEDPPERHDKKRKRTKPDGDRPKTGTATPKPGDGSQRMAKKQHVGQDFWPFAVDYCDHFETSSRAIQDIRPVLQALCKKLKKGPTGLAIYDPFFCKGGIRRHYEALGFTNFIHRNRDFYKDVASGCVPEYDVMVTNPPYSADHKERILDFCLRSGKPWALLLPNYVATKAYFSQLLSDTATPGPQRPFYLTPTVRYNYDHPEGTGHAESPFYSIWYVGLGQHTEAVYGTCRAQLDQAAAATAAVVTASPGGKGAGKKAASSGGSVPAAGDGWAVTLARSVDALKQAGAVPTARRLNPKQRERLKKHKM